MCRLGRKNPSRYAYRNTRNALYWAYDKKLPSSDAEATFNRERNARLQGVEQPARRKLLQIHYAKKLEDLAALPGNRLEALKGDRRGQYSIRINDRLRICFRWERGDAYDVEIVDYH